MVGGGCAVGLFFRRQNKSSVWTLLLVCVGRCSGSIPYTRLALLPVPVLWLSNRAAVLNLFESEVFRHRPVGSV